MLHTSARPSDITSLYLSAMSHAPLALGEEARLGQAMEESERQLVTAAASDRQGRAALAAIAEEIRDGRLGPRDVLRNPDEEGLDAAAAAAAVATGLARGRSPHRLAPAVLARVAKAPTRARPVARVRAALQAGEAAKERLVVSNLRLVVMLAKRYAHRGLPLLDLVQEGNLGLIRAVEKYDWRRGLRLGTYAAWWIRQAIQRALLEKGKVVRMPVRVADRRRKLARARQGFVVEHHREPTRDELSTASGIRTSEVDLLSMSLETTSLDAPALDGEGSRLVERVADPSGKAPDEQVAAKGLAESVGAMLGKLPPRQREILRLRYGLGGARDHTLEEVGRALSLSRERIRQIEADALKRLRGDSEQTEIESYLRD